MNREQLAHVLRAAARITRDGEIIVIGSQAILGSFPDDALPPETMMSVEADVAFRDDPDEHKSDEVDAMIGEDSQFHATHGYYGQGVSVTTAVLPTGWEGRVIPYRRDDANPSHAVCIEAHDLVVSKLVAGREKDIVFATALIRAQLVDVKTLLRRVDALEQPGAVRSRVRERVLRCAATAKDDRRPI